ncbi:hypothetical protein QC761_611000 [Podospora bellae-mahoneyi]|uniref:Transcription factor domain-containing protein n=1 Tax=Podospora bellae-mahoneyi TaxID=2093777 RepID=A0ABR0FDA0_9PEZI|nr:hypothetical protein QC761_611000 [Podospora bellae-mahoneyi]
MRAKAIQTTKWGTACAQCASAKAKCSGRLTWLLTRILGLHVQMRAPAEAMYRSSPPSSQDSSASTVSPDHLPGSLREPSFFLTFHTLSRPAAGLGEPSFDSLVSTPENPPSPSAVDLGADFASCSSSSVRSHTSAATPMGSLDVRPSLIRTSSMQSQQSVQHESYFFTASPPHCLNQQHLNPLLIEGLEDLDDLLLNRYRTCLMPAHPFVLIPDHVSASMLVIHRPFLMLAIRVVAGFEGLHSVQGQMQHIMDHVADRMFRQAERSIDLLMGIVVVLGWYHYHCMRHSQLNNLLCLAESLVSDLGINKRPQVQNEGRMADEKRLLLGVWYLRSSAAMYLQQLTSMPFTSYMRQCLVELDEEEDHDLDEILVYCIKLQYLTERVAVLKTPQPDLPEQQNRERGTAIASSQEYLDKLMREMPSELKTNYTNTQIRAWFEGWVQGIPAQAYRTLPSNLVFQLLYAVGSLLRSHGAASQPPPSSSTRGDAEVIVILDRLVALCFANFIGGQPQPDMTHFWEALGERHQTVCSPSPSVSEHGDDSNGPLTATPATWEQQYRHGSNVFTPPSRVGSAAPDPKLEAVDVDQYQVASLPMMTSNQLHSQSQWDSQTTQTGWDHHTATPQGQMLMVPGAEGVVNPQLWGQDQGTGAYHHSEGGYFMG